MISLSHVYKTYNGPVHALKNVDLEIGKGEFVFLTGPSGAGKSTLFRLICGFDKATSGKLNVAGFDLTQTTDREIPYFRRRIGVVFQDFKLLKDRNLFDNVALPMHITSQRKEYTSRRVREVLEQVGLLHKENQLPTNISGGEQQRTAIARALVHKPGVLIADEPTGNLDPRLSEEIMDLLDKVSAQGTTVFVATHNHQLVRERRKRVIKIESGMLIGDIR